MLACLTSTDALGDLASIVFNNVLKEPLVQVTWLAPCRDACIIVTQSRYRTGEEQKHNGADGRPSHLLWFPLLTLSFNVFIFIYLLFFLCVVFNAW